jgi:hypothetical protein
MIRKLMIKVIGTPIMILIIAVNIAPAPAAKSRALLIW